MNFFYLNLHGFFNFYNKFELLSSITATNLPHRIKEICLFLRFIQINSVLFSIYLLFGKIL